MDVVDVFIGEREADSDAFDDLDGTVVGVSVCEADDADVVVGDPDVEGVRVVDRVAVAVGSMDVDKVTVRD